MMLRPASRLLVRPAFVRPIARITPARRLLSTAPPSQKSRSWKNYGVRLGLAGAVVYYYTTTDIFAEEPALAHLHSESQAESENLPTIEALAEERKQKRAAPAAAQQQDVAIGSEGQVAPAPSGGEIDSVEALEEEAGQQGAFNPETGEINWDCPCLGGMADGPCGPQFKEAFSCFVFSEQEPKGMDCIDKFKNMQDCFRLHPDVYGAELEDDEEPPRDPEVEAQTPTTSQVDTNTGSPKSEAPPSKEGSLADASKTSPAQGTKDGSAVGESVQEKKSTAKKVAEELKDTTETSESESLVPKAAHDSR